MIQELTTINIAPINGGLGCVCSGDLRLVVQTTKECKEICCNKPGDIFATFEDGPLNVMAVILHNDCWQKCSYFDKRLLAVIEQASWSFKQSPGF